MGEPGKEPRRRWRTARSPEPAQEAGRNIVGENLQQNTGGTNIGNQHIITVYNLAEAVDGQRLLGQARPPQDAVQNPPAPLDEHPHLPVTISPTVPAPAPPVGGVEEILAAQRKTIAVQDELLGCQRVLAVSERARDDARLVADSLLETIRHLTAIIRELSDLVTTGDGGHLRPRLDDAVDERTAAHTELARAERDRMIFGHVAESARHTIERLRTELARIHGTPHTTHPSDTTGSTVLAPVFDHTPLEDAARTLTHARLILDQRENAVRTAVDDLGGIERLTPPGQPRNPPPPTAPTPRPTAAPDAAETPSAATGERDAAVANTTPARDDTPTSPRGPSRRTLIRGAAALAATAGALVVRGDGRNQAPYEISSSLVVVEGVVYFGSNYGVYAVDAATGKQKRVYLPGGYSVSLSPVVVEGVVYIVSDNRVYAVDAATGKQKWDLLDGYYLVSLSPVVVEGVVYIVSAFGAYAVEAATGKKKWEYTSALSFSPTLEMVNELVKVVVAVEGAAYIVRGFDVYAVEAATGKQKWVHTTGVSVSLSPVVVEGVVYIGSGDDRVYAVEAATGEQKWVYSTGVSVSTSPVVVEGVVYFVGGFKVYAVDAATGKRKWEKRPGSFSSSSLLVVVEGVVYFGGGVGVYAMDAATGEPKWNYSDGRSVLSSSLVVVEGVVYFVSGDDRVYAVDAATGKQKWNYSDGRSVYSSLVVVDRAVYLGSSSRVYAVDAATGKRIWVYPSGGSTNSLSMVVDRAAYIGSDDHSVNALNAATGKAPRDPGFPGSI